MSYQENIVGNQLTIVFALAIALVYLCLRRPVRELDRADQRHPGGAAVVDSGRRSRSAASAPPTISTPRSA